MARFIDEHRGAYGVEPICEVLPIAPSIYYELKAREREPARRPVRARRDEDLCEQIGRVWRENHEVYGPRKVWKQMKREGHGVARCTIERLMRANRWRGVTRTVRVRTTVADPAATRAPDLVNRNFHADRPDQLWVADFTYVATWAGFAYVAFVIDVCSRLIVGWRADTTMRTSLVLDALEMAFWTRNRAGVTDLSGLIHHNDYAEVFVKPRSSDLACAA